MRSGNAKGQALAEFIIVIPLFLVVMLGVIQFSLLYFAYQMVHYASFAAARAAIVRPCAAFHPDDQAVPHFTPAVFTAATLATMVAMPSQCIVQVPDGTKSGCPAGLDASFDFMPRLNAVSEEVRGIGFAGEDDPSADLALTRFVNAAYLTSVQRVHPETFSLGVDPMSWVPYPLGPGPGIPCDVGGADQQNVPAPGEDLTLEVTLIYPMTVPLVNRVIFGIFVNFSSVAQERLAMDQIFGAEGGPEDVMVYPRRVLPLINRPARFGLLLLRSFQEFGYSGQTAAGGSWGALGAILDGFASRAWYPIPIRARCTLTTEGSMYLMGGPPGSRGW